MQTELHNFEPFVPANEAWQKLKPMLDKEEKRRKGFVWWWFASFAFVVALGTSVYLYNKPVKTIAINSSTNQTSSSSTINNEKNLTTNIPSTTKKEIAINSNIQSKKLETVNDLTKKRIIEASNDISKTNLKSIQNPKLQKITNEQIATSNDLSITNLQSIQNPKLQTTTNQQPENRNDVSITTQQSPQNLKLQTTTNEKIETGNYVTKNQKLETKKELQYGLQWNIPFTKNVNFLNINRANNPAVVFIPSVYVKKPFGKKSSVELYFNPYSTHYINNKTVMQQNNYNITIAQGTRVVTNTYTETNAVNKLTSVELGFFYGYNVSKRLMVRAGVSNNWSNWAMLNTTVLRNGSEVTLDTLYSISKTSPIPMWGNINPTFVLGKLDVLYSFNKLEVGVNFTTPLKPLTNLPNDNTPINTNLFMRWRLK